jgi:hypothetical protein
VIVNAENYTTSETALVNTGVTPRGNQVADGTTDYGAELSPSPKLLSNNVAPEVAAGADQIVFENDAVNLEPATFSDPDSNDTHNATIDWGDGIIEVRTVDEEANTVSGAHLYEAVGIYLVTITVTDSAGIRGTDSFVASIVHGFMRFCTYATQDVVQIEERANLSCNVGGRGLIELKKDSIINGNVVGYDDIKIAKNAFVGGDVTAAGNVSLESGAVVTGTVTSNAILASITEIGVNVVAGGTNVIVGQGRTVSLSEGVYGDLIVGKNATLRFSGGTYAFNRIVVQKDVVIEFELVTSDHVVIDVVDNVELKQGVRMVNVSGEPSDILFRIGGSNVKLEKNGTYLGTFIAPNAHIDMHQGAALAGMLYGRKVQLKRETSISPAPALDLFILETIGNDHDLPSIVASLDPQPNAAGWNNGNVTVSFDCSDTTSGIASCTEPVLIDTEGADQEVVGTAVDLVGNSTSISVLVNVDKTAPNITAIRDPQPNANGWNNSDVTVSFDATDSLSGIEGVSSSTTVTTEGANQITEGTATDIAGNTANLNVSVSIDRTSPTVEILSPTDGETFEVSQVTVTGTASDLLSDIDTVTCNGNPASLTDSTFTCMVSLNEGTNPIQVQASDRAENSASASISVFFVPPTGNLPPDPGTVATILNNSVATDIFNATSFIYTGSNPIQTGAVPGTIEASRVAILRGKVLTRDGQPLSGVTIQILHHPEFGQTLSRADGAFDLVVNGGGLLTVRYEKAGYLFAQHQANPRWRDYTWLNDVVLIPYDARVTSIDLSSSDPIQVARGSVVSDTRGTRQATLLFAAGTQAAMSLPDGSSQPLTTLHVRASEFSVGENGPMAMPATLPSTVAYTHATAFTVDEAIAAGATSVDFSSPVIFYQENFIGFPVGEDMPLGEYDANTGLWVPYPNGRVIEVLSITDGFADLDIDGSGQPASPSALAELGVTDVERAQVAVLYTAGQTLWRAEISHFSYWDT